MNLNEIDLLKENNARQMWHPMAHPAESQQNPPRIIASAQGVRITDVDGHTTIDGVGGLWNVNLGYSCEPVKRAIAAQLETLPYYSAFRGSSSAPAIELSALVGQWFAPDGMTRSFFTSGGSDSVESALRLARQYHKIRGDRDRTKFISLKRGYHGTHFGAASVNGNTNFRRNYEPLLAGCFHVATPYPYRNPFNLEDPAALAQACAATLEDEIAFQGPDTVAAFIMEPVLGAGGVIPPHESFMPMVREICTRHGILLIADEVITSFGRTGAWTGSRLFGVQPDMMCIAKAITNGYFPFGATLLSGAVAEVFEKDQSAFSSVFHGYTYSAHPVGAAAALACIPELTRLNVAANAQARGEQLLAGANALMNKYQVIGDVRGKGLMIALELVSDRKKKTPLDKDTVARISAATYEAGLMARIAGHNLLLSPPLVITDDDVTAMLAALDTLAAAGTV